MPLKFQLDWLTLTPVRVHQKATRNRHTHTHRRILQNHVARRSDGCTSSQKSIDSPNFLKPS